VSGLDDVFSATRRPDSVESAQDLAPVAFPNGVRPSWAGRTALYRTLGDRDLNALGAEAVAPGVTAVEGKPLPKRALTWVTGQGEQVTIGDVVALGILGNPDALGLIVGPGDGGRVECLLGDHDDPLGTRPTLEVEAYQLRMLLRRGVKPKMPSDYTRDATPLMRDPETEEKDDSAEGEGSETEPLAA